MTRREGHRFEILRWVCGDRVGPGRDVVADVEQQLDVAGTTVTIEDALEDLLFPARAFTARCALAAGLSGVEPHQAQRGLYRVGGVVHDHDGAGAEHRAGGTDRACLEWQRHLLGEEPWRGTAARNERLQRATGQHALAIVVAVDQVFIGGDTLFDLVDTGALDLAGHGEHASAGRGFGAELLVGVGPIDHEPWQVRQRLDVVHDRRLTVQANGSWEERWLQTRHAAVALEALDKCRLFAHDVGAGAPVQHDVAREVGAEDVLADVTLGVRLVQRISDALLSNGHLTTNVEEALREPDGVARNEAALDELMRIALHEQTVLVGAGLGLVAVDHEVARPYVRWAKSPFDAGGEACATTTEQRGITGDAVTVVGRLLERLLEAVVPTGRLVALDRVAVLVVETLGDDLGARAVDIAGCVRYVFARGHQSSFDAAANHTGASLIFSGAMMCAVCSSVMT